MGQRKGVEVHLAYFGSFLVGKRCFAISSSHADFPDQIPVDDWESEVKHDFDFPEIDIEKITLYDGYSSEQVDNPLMAERISELVTAEVENYLLLIGYEHEEHLPLKIEPWMHVFSPDDWDY